MSETKQNAKNAFVSTHISRELRARVQAVARENGRSVASEVRRLLEQNYQDTAARQ
jgi:Arc-like DNA binding dprotein